MARLLKCLIVLFALGVVEKIVVDNILVVMVVMVMVVMVMVLVLRTGWCQRAFGARLA